MLILTRRIGETLLMKTEQGQIELIVLGVNGSQVRVGIKAPQEVVILRAELEKGEDE